MVIPDGYADHALQLEVKRGVKDVEVHVVGLSRKAQQVRYSLELRGSSVSRHRATVSLPGNSRQLLSTMRMSADQPWCVILTVVEASGRKYDLSEGVCTAVR